MDQFNFTSSEKFSNSTIIHFGPIFVFSYYFMLALVNFVYTYFLQLLLKCFTLGKSFLLNFIVDLQRVCQKLLQKPMQCWSQKLLSRLGLNELVNEWFKEWKHIPVYLLNLPAQQ